MANNRSGSFWGGLLLGSAIGTVTGLLMAPRPGRETRQLLKKSADALPELAEDLSSSVQLQADRLSESALRRWDGTLTRLRQAIAEGLEASRLEQTTLEQADEELEEAPKGLSPDALNASEENYYNTYEPPLPTETSPS